MPLVKSTSRRQREIYRQIRGKVEGRLKQLIAELDIDIAANGGAGDAGILASWGNAEFGTGFKAVVDAIRAFTP